MHFAGQVVVLIPMPTNRNGRLYIDCSLTDLFIYEQNSERLLWINRIHLPREIIIPFVSDNFLHNFL